MEHHVTKTGQGEGACLQWFTRASCLCGFTSLQKIFIRFMTRSYITMHKRPHSPQKHFRAEFFRKQALAARQEFHLVDIYLTVARMAVTNVGPASTDVQLRSCRQTSAIRPSFCAARSQRRHAAVRVCASAPSQGACSLMRAVSCKPRVKNYCTTLTKCVRVFMLGPGGVLQA